MFALALWDTEQRAFVGFDRYGIKPLYYSVYSTFLFGSEIKAILSHPAYRTEMNYEGLCEYLTFQNYFSDQTLFKMFI